MIHEITQKVLETNISYFDILTFDDGLYTQYLNYKHFLKFNKPMYFFISTNIICPKDKKQSDEVIYCGDAHKKAFNGNFENYMTWEQIKEIYNTPGCFIGGHTHTHPRIKVKGLVNQYNICKIEVANMLQTFKENNININSFCFPYNEDFITYRGLLKGFDFFGKERVAIEDINT